MRIGIVSWYWGNYGSILQAYALQEVLKTMGHEPIHIRHNFDDSAVFRVIDRVKVNGAVSSLKYYTNRLIGKMHQKDVCNEIAIRDKALSAFIENNISLTDKLYVTSDYSECVNEADAFICGSDQIWNPAITSYMPFYWLSFVPDCIPKIAYAPSIGEHRYSKRAADYIVNQLNTYSDVSVREKSSAQQLNSLPGMFSEVKVVLDPTLLLDNQSWIRFASRSKKATHGDDPYAFIYLLRGTVHQQKYAADFSKSRGLKTVSYPYLEADSANRAAYHSFDQEVLDDDPIEFVRRIRDASLVITDSFHCTVFSILFQKDFYVLEKASDMSSQLTRLVDLLKMCGLEERLIRESIPQPLNSDFGYSNAIIRRQAQSSRHFLENALAKSMATIGEYAAE